MNTTTHSTASSDISDKLPYSEIVLALMTDEPFLISYGQQIQKICAGKDKWNWIVNCILKYHERYAGLPTENILLSELEKEFTETHSKALKLSIMEAITLNLGLLSDSPNVSSMVQYVKDTISTYIYEENLKQTILNAATAITNKDFPTAESYLLQQTLFKSNNAVTASMGSDIFDSIGEILSRDLRETIKTNWKGIDDDLNGGLGKGELGVIMSQTNNGKSWTLVRLGAEAWKQKKNVLHVSTEMSLEETNQRYWNYLLNTNNEEIKRDKTTATNTIQKMKSEATITTLPFSMKTKSVADIRNFLKTSTRKYDMVVIDYADYLVPSFRNNTAQNYQELGQIYCEIKALAQDFSIPVWTCTQTNRGGYGNNRSENPTLTDIADSVRKAEIADILISMLKTEGSSDLKHTMLSVEKNRHGRNGKKHCFTFNTSTGQMLEASPDLILNSGKKQRLQGLDKFLN
jgi:replicative DNA helicase